MVGFIARRAERKMPTPTHWSHEVVTSSGRGAVRGTMARCAETGSAEPVALDAASLAVCGSDTGKTRSGPLKSQAVVRRTLMSMGLRGAGLGRRKTRYIPLKSHYGPRTRGPHVQGGGGGLYIVHGPPVSGGEARVLG
ncbi:hypothetical protein E2562_015956 [Oryza meyeriana var. granulata]|uniref:Uncharacterized protein n=1 Tax=Oryza meyeriana var. granulata TaxID=110450 RepID=A0A6G1EK85_9ORYZ|nr:hypothetical protein E2562_015956 [Oryza meyeriana var. granulata]